MKNLSILFFFAATLIVTHTVQARAPVIPQYNVGSGNNAPSLLTVMATTEFGHDLKYKCKDLQGREIQQWTNLANGEMGMCHASVLIAVKADCDDCKRKRLYANGCAFRKWNPYTPSMSFYIDDNGNDRVERHCSVPLN